MSDKSRKKVGATLWVVFYPAVWGSKSVKACEIGLGEWRVESRLASVVHGLKSNGRILRAA
jgi:hypothetical protein